MKRVRELIRSVGNKDYVIISEKQSWIYYTLSPETYEYIKEFIDHSKIKVFDSKKLDLVELFKVSNKKSYYDAFSTIFTRFVIDFSKINSYYQVQVITDAIESKFDIRDIYDLKSLYNFNKEKTKRYFIELFNNELKEYIVDYEFRR